MDLLCHGRFEHFQVIFFFFLNPIVLVTALFFFSPKCIFIQGKGLMERGIVTFDLIFSRMPCVMVFIFLFKK